MSTPLPIALVLEDEREIRRFVRTALESEGWTVHEAQTLRQGLIDAGTRRPDLVIADLGLPDGDGIDFIRQLRSWSGIPVIVLSARTQESDKVAALDAGADDFITKPFGVAELLARTRANLRRTRAGRVLTHPYLLREVWGPTHAQSTHYLRVYMGNLRQKLEDDSARPRHIVTETGVGYRLLAD